ncbi:MAG: hypothetical protein IT437_02920 [Phycisphaerales bacterium]|nr:hypothetical protein [Phycisphaerales bacterium]
MRFRDDRRRSQSLASAITAAALGFGMLADTLLAIPQPERALGEGWCSTDDAGDGNTVPSRWPGGIVPYRFNTNVTALNQQRSVEAMAEIEAVCNVDFIPWTGQAAYIFINASNVNSSCVGYGGGFCTVNIAEWYLKGTIIHEFGHSLGLHHEQKRTDRDQYVQVNMANTCNAGNNYTIAGTAFGPYDFESIMHYSRYGWTRDGGPVMTVLPAYAEWKYYCGDGDSLSNGDIWVLSEMYGGSSWPRPPRTFALTAPAHRARVGTGWTPSFQWQSGAGADSYHLQVDDDPYFTSPEIDVSVVGTSHVSGTPLPDGRVFFWRVTGVNGTGETEARPRPVRRPRT